MKALHALWPLLIGLIGTESLFEDRNGSGNLREIQVHSSTRSGTGRAWSPVDNAEEFDERLAQSWNDAAEAAKPESQAGRAQPNEGKALDPDDIVAQAGARIEPPQPDLIERALAADAPDSD